MTQYFSGLDLGQQADYSALVVVEQTQKMDPDRPRHLENHYAVRHLHRWQLGTPYPQVVSELHDWFRTAPLHNSTLVIDATGVGRPVVDMVKASGIPADIRPFSITCGLAPGDGTVPKKDLCGAVQTTLQTRRIRFAEELEHTPTIKKELENFRVKVTSDRNEAFAAWRENDKDDLVLALALAIWYAERHGSCGVIQQPVIPTKLPAWAFKSRPSAQR